MNKLNPLWPVLKSYDQDHLGCIGMPLGGIGTGTVSLGGRGNLFNYELHNQPRKDNSSYGLFVLYTRPQGADTAALRALEGVLPPPYEGDTGVKNVGYGDFPRFRECSFHTAYPFAQVCLDDPLSPLEVRLEAFNPLVPNDADKSGIPMAVLRYVLINKTSVPVDASICAIHQNGIGKEVENLSNDIGKKVEKQRNRFRKSADACGLFYDVSEENNGDRSWGSKALATDAADVSHTSHWRAESWRRPTLHFCDDLLADGRLDDYETENRTANSSLAASVTVPPGGQCEVTFLLSWHFPNRYSWHPKKQDSGCGCDTLDPDDLVGNYYTGQYADAWDVIAKEMPRLKELESESLRFVHVFCASDLPEVIKESALFNVSTLRTETCFRTADGNFYAWEGCCDGNGCCHGSCTHVWNYETATAFLFGDIARNMRDIEFRHCTHAETGNMSFRVALPLNREKGEGKAAADGQMGCIMKIYREWRLSGDESWLKTLWPQVRKALEFCWIKGGWDADKDGVMEGCQHNTMDVEYYGPNPQMGTWYLGALRAAEEMARHLGERDFADDCRRLFENGSKWLDANLFNGEYYEQIVQPPDKDTVIYPTLTVGAGASDLSKPDLQLGPACLVDQLVGQYMAHACGLGYLLDAGNLQKTLESIMKYNFMEDFYNHLNHLRIYVINDESALLMATFPHGNRPESPFPYFTEVMTGFEYTAGIHMLYEGQIDPGLKVIASIRKRYDGKRRNPFDEAECGHHYGRAMAAWTGVLAWTGFEYDGATRTMRFAAREGHWFWSNGYAYGTCDIHKAEDGTFSADLAVLHGQLELDALLIGGKQPVPKALLKTAGERFAAFDAERRGNEEA